MGAVIGTALAAAGTFITEAAVAGGLTVATTGATAVELASLVPLGAGVAEGVGAAAGIATIGGAAAYAETALTSAAAGASYQTVGTFAPATIYSDNILLSILADYGAEGSASWAGGDIGLANAALQSTLVEGGTSFGEISSFVAETSFGTEITSLAPEASFAAASEASGAATYQVGQLTQSLIGLGASGAILATAWGIIKNSQGSFPIGSKQYPEPLFNTNAQLLCEVLYGRKGRMFCRHILVEPVRVQSRSTRYGRVSSAKKANLLATRSRKVGNSKPRSTKSRKVVKSRKRVRSKSVK